MADKQKPEKLDFKKQQKELYQPGAKPALVQVPEMGFFAVDGTGAPEDADYQGALAALYALTWTVKMSKMAGPPPPGYVEYAVAPLEGLWDNISFDGKGNRRDWRWTSLIRQPDFVDEAVFAWAVEEAGRKKPQVDVGRARFLRWQEGLCAQLMHTGPYSAEGPSMQRLDAFIAAQGLRADYGTKAGTLTRRHHEIYLGDPRRTAPEKRKTVLRTPVAPL